MIINVEFRKLREGAKLPEKSTTHAAGYDVRAWIPEKPIFANARGDNHSFYNNNEFKFLVGAAEIKDKFVGGRLNVKPGETVVIPTGLNMKIPIGFAVLFLPRSGKSIEGHRIANSPGLIDADYVGNDDKFELKAIFHNVGPDDAVISHGDKIGQLVLTWVPEMVIVEKESLVPHESNRVGGLGSTGVS